eukprot:778330_1
MTHSDEYLFLIGGYDLAGDIEKVHFPEVQVLKWATIQWVNQTLALIRQIRETRGRSNAVCEVLQDRLFVFGGKSVIKRDYSSDIIYHQTSEVISVTNFLDNTWNYTASLTHPLEMSRSAASGDFIYIVSGSWNNVKQNSFHIFDVTTDTMTRSPFDLPYALIQHTVVISEEQQILYVFGGSQQTNTWLYLGLIDTDNPSTHPSPAPTGYPTQPTTIPSAAPTETRDWCDPQIEVFYENADELQSKWSITAANYNSNNLHTHYGSDNDCYFESCYGIEYDNDYYCWECYHYPYGTLDPSLEWETYATLQTPIDLTLYENVNVKYGIGGECTNWCTRPGAECSLSYSVDNGASNQVGSPVLLQQTYGVNIQFFSASLPLADKSSNVRLKLSLLQRIPNEVALCWFDEITVCGTPRTADPTSGPTRNPTLTPTNDPTNQPTITSGNPSASPTNAPTVDTMDPTMGPTIDPSVDPTVDPTVHPTSAPTNSTMDPPNVPTISTLIPTYVPTGTDT